MITVKNKAINYTNFIILKYDPFAYLVFRWKQKTVNIYG